MQGYASNNFSTCMYLVSVNYCLSLSLKSLTMLSISIIICKQHNHCIPAGVWQARDETANPNQKHDVELIKDDKRYTVTNSSPSPPPPLILSALFIGTALALYTLYTCM